jgi:hypothetical protein
MSASYPETRSDFRCLLCRRQNVFHCEHDTPYRDRYLGTYDSNTSQNHNNHSRKSKNENTIHYNATNNGGSTARQQVNTNNAVQYQQEQTFDTRTNINTNGSSKTFVQKKKSRSCVIL